MVYWGAISLAIVVAYLLPKTYITEKLCNYFKTKPIEPRQKTVVAVLNDMGMNYEKARKHALEGSKLIIGSNDLEKASIARRELLKFNKNNNISIIHLDTKQKSSLQEFAKQIIEKENYIDTLINNEGFELGELDINFNKQQLASERFHNHCLDFFYEGGEVRNYKLPGWHLT